MFLGTMDAAREYGTASNQLRSPIRDEPNHSAHPAVDIVPIIVLVDTVFLNVQEVVDGERHVQAEPAHRQKAKTDETGSGQRRIRIGDQPAEVSAMLQ